MRNLPFGGLWGCVWESVSRVKALIGSIEADWFPVIQQVAGILLATANVAIGRARWAMKMRFGMWILTLLALRGFAHAAPATPEEVLKGKGLIKVGALYLLEIDIKLPEKVRAIRAAKFKVDENASKRIKLEKDIESAIATISQCERQAADLNASLPNAKKVGVYKYNETLGQIRAVDATAVEAIAFLQRQEKELNKLGDPSDDYINSLVDASDKMEAAARQYQSLATDEEVKAALATLNQKPGPKMRLGPSPQFNSELPGIHKMRESVRGTVIKLTVVAGGIPEAK